MSTFHFLRPEWFLALIPVALVLAVIWRSSARIGSREWSGVVDAHLLKHLTVSGQAARPRRGLIVALAAGLLASVVALAGPTWQKLPVPTVTGGEPTVVALSLAQSMNGTDLVPSRLARAGHKLRDILERAQGGEIGLVIYADRPFVAAPLTPDAAVIGEMLPELSTSLMPVLGNRLDRAIAASQELLASAGATRGRILVMADDLGVDPEASLAAARAAHKAGFEVDVLGVGTPEGAALQTADGRTIQVGGAARVARLDTAAMQSLAEAGGGRYSAVTPGSADLDRLLPAQTGAAGAGTASDLKADRWADKGYLLVLIPVLLMPFAFRRGLLFALAVMAFGFGAQTGPAAAEGLDDLWATPDQQGARAFAEGDFAAAAEDFASPDWRASALYRAGEYDAAAGLYGESGYNAGNALAKAGKLEEALAAYDAALAANPGDADAQFNRDLVADLLKQQEEQKQQQEQQQQQKPDQQQQQDQAQSGQSGQDQQQDQQQGGQDQKDQQDQQQSGQNDQAGRQQDNQSGGAGQDQQTADQQQANGGDQDQQQQQQQGENGQAQDQASQADKSGQDKPQSGKQQAAGQDQTGQSGQTGKQQAQDAAQGQQSEQPGQQQSAQAEPQQADSGGEAAEDQGVLSGLIDRLLQGNGEAGETEAPANARATTGTPLDQAGEQQLRAVPDDPAGLLRARIRQHYAQLRANGQ